MDMAIIIGFGLVIVFLIVVIIKMIGDQIRESKKKL